MIPLDTSFFGLPLHPLVVHLVVVALPVGALATAAAVVSPWFRARFGTLSVLTLTVGALASVAAFLTGQRLAEAVPFPERHAVLGTWTMSVGLATAAAAWLWWWLERRREQAPPGTSSFGAIAVGGLVATAALAVAVLAGLTGHAGAQATWGSRMATPTAPAASGTWTMADVEQHASAASCWAAVDGHVYDLTSWVNGHPGGRQRILNLCGTDASQQFRAQHASNPRPNAQLERMRIGTLA